MEAWSDGTCKAGVSNGKAASWVARYGTYGYRRTYNGSNGRQSAVSTSGMHCGGARVVPELVTCTARSGLMAVGENIGPLQRVAFGPQQWGDPPAALPNKAAIFSIFQGDGSGALPSHARKRATRRQFPSSCDLTRAKLHHPKLLHLPNFLSPSPPISNTFNSVDSAAQPSIAHANSTANPIRH